MLISKVLPTLATRLFGASAFMNISAIIRPPIRRFLEVIVTHTWNRYWRNTSKEVKKLEKDKASLNEQWKGK